MYAYNSIYCYPIIHINIHIIFFIIGNTRSSPLLCFGVIDVLSIFPNHKKYGKKYPFNHSTSCNILLLLTSGATNSVRYNKFPRPIIFPYYY